MQKCFMHHFLLKPLRIKRCKFVACINDMNNFICEYPSCNGPMAKPQLIYPRTRSSIFLNLMCQTCGQNSFLCTSLTLKTMQSWNLLNSVNVSRLQKNHMKGINTTRSRTLLKEKGEEKQCNMQISKKRRKN